MGSPAARPWLGRLNQADIHNIVQLCLYNSPQGYLIPGSVCGTADRIREVVVKVGPVVDGNRYYAHTIATVALCLVVIAAIAEGCTRTSADEAKQRMPGFMETAQDSAPVTFTNNIYRVALTRCSGCHQGPMTKYDVIFDRGWVVPGNPDESPYYTKGIGQAEHIGGNAWGESAEMVRLWIASGAPR